MFGRDAEGRSTAADGGCVLVAIEKAVDEVEDEEAMLLSDGPATATGSAGDCRLGFAKKLATDFCCCDGNLAGLDTSASW